VLSSGVADDISVNTYPLGRGAGHTSTSTALPHLAKDSSRESSGFGAPVATREPSLWTGPPATGTTFSSRAELQGRAPEPSV
jgi:hypothetical protein